MDEDGEGPDLRRAILLPALLGQGEVTGLHELAALEYEVVRSLGARLVLDVVTADIENTTILG